MTQRKISEIIGDIYGHSKTYIKNYVQYLGYDSAEKFVIIASYILTNFIIAAITGVFVNIVILALIFYIGYINNAMAAALLFIAIFYFLLALIFLIFRNSLIKKPIQKQIIQFIFSQKESEEKQSEN